MRMRLDDVLKLEAALLDDGQIALELLGYFRSVRERYSSDTAG